MYASRALLKAMHIFLYAQRILLFPLRIRLYIELSLFSYIFKLPAVNPYI